ncbi:sigma factor [Saccharothrix sp. ST-888]|uniref:sigma factor n=1 Tax=Saccharothrix sp. ST-888 TaxID=1427391 RepID=UPI0022B14480|nr:sigma factor [Saccharothrix sp. ST-888]
MIQDSLYTGRIRIRKGRLPALCLRPARHHPIPDPPGDRPDARTTRRPPPGRPSTVTAGLSEASGTVRANGKSTRGYRWLISGWRRELTGHGHRMPGSAFEAEDVVQEPMIRAWRGHRTFEGRAAPKQRAVPILRKVPGRRANEVAELLGTTVASVDSASSRRSDEFRTAARSTPANAPAVNTPAMNTPTPARRRAHVEAHVRRGVPGRPGRTAA